MEAVPTSVRSGSKGKLGACPSLAADLGWRAPINASTSTTHHHNDVPSPASPTRYLASPPPQHSADTEQRPPVPFCSASSLLVPYSTTPDSALHRRTADTKRRTSVASPARALRTAREPAMVRAPSSRGGAPGIHAVHAPQRLEPNLRPALSHWPRTALFRPTDTYCGIPTAAAAVCECCACVWKYVDSLSENCSAARTKLTAAHRRRARVLSDSFIFADRLTLCLPSQHEMQRPHASVHLVCRCTRRMQSPVSNMTSRAFRRPNSKPHGTRNVRSKLRPCFRRPYISHICGASLQSYRGAAQCNRGSQALALRWEPRRPCAGGCLCASAHIVARLFRARAFTFASACIALLYGAATYSENVISSPQDSTSTLDSTSTCACVDRELIIKSAARVCVRKGWKYLTYRVSKWEHACRAQAATVSRVLRRALENTHVAQTQVRHSSTHNRNQAPRTTVALLCRRNGARNHNASRLAARWRRMRGRL
jgi:hypothetical protein